MINKKNVLGKTPEELGIKDAVHVAIVSVRAGDPIKPGQRVGMNQYGEATPNGKGPGVANPFVNAEFICRGETFWLLLDQDEIPNVRHEWEHPTISFGPPTRELPKNATIAKCAHEFGVTYQHLMEAVSYVASNSRPAQYPGVKSADDVDAAEEKIGRWDLFYEWAQETGFEFPSSGDACCPEHEYPDCPIFDTRLMPRACP